MGSHTGAGANIVNISSVAATAALPNVSVYSATKASVDAITRSLATESGPRKIRVNAIYHRVTSEEIVLSREDFDDLCRIHLFDWLEQVPRSRHGWGYRRAAYRALAERLGGKAIESYDRVFATEPIPADSR